MAFRRSIICAAVLSILSWLSVDLAWAQASYDFDLPEQSLAESLRQIGQRAAMNILFEAGSVAKMRAPAVRGRMSAEQALERVLADTDLVVELLNGNSVVIRRQEKVHPRKSTSPDHGPSRPPPLVAQPQPQPEALPGPPPPEPLSLQEVTVTAQRRDENSQAVPITIDTLSGEDAEVRGVVGIQTLSATVPNLTMTMTGFTSNTYIRGVGTTSASPNNEPSTATYVDGVYMPSSFALTGFAFNNIERIEVLKGPQGTLFGRNTTAGVIQIVTPDPQHDFHAKVDLGHANYNMIDADTYLTGGITDELAADLSVYFEDQLSGWGYNPTYHTGIFVHQNIAARSKWLYTPGETTEVKVAFDYSRFFSDGGNNQLVPGSYAIDHVTTYPGKFISVGEVTRNDDAQYGASVRVDHDFDWLHGASISSYRHVNGHWLADNDLTPEPLTTIETWNRADYVTQELQFSNEEPGRITWLAGAFFYANQVNGANPEASFGTNVGGGYRGAYGVQYTRSTSGFGQATADLFADTKLTLGLRYTDETLKTRGQTLNGSGQVISGPFRDQIDFAPWTWRVALEHPLAPGTLGYVSYNHGFKSGGYNLFTPGSAPFFPETVDAYEIGLKSEFLDRRIRLNLAAFYYDYQNIQVTIVPGGGSQIFANAAAARNYGVDASLEVAATEHLTFSTGLGALSAKYQDYPNAQGFTRLGVPFTIANAKGQDLPFAPPFTAFVTAAYRIPTRSGDFKGTANLTYTDKSYITPDQGLERPAYFLLTASIEWWPVAAKSFGIRLWGRNLTNAYYPVFMVESSGGWYESPAAPRTYGLMLMKQF